MISKTLYKITILLVLATMSLLPAACSAGAAAEAPTSTPLPTPIVPVKPVYTVKRGDVMNSISFTGRITPVTQQSLFFKTDGRVRTIYVKEGDNVKKGDVLADLEVMSGLSRQKGLGDLAVQRAQIQLDMANLALKQATSSAYSASEKTYDVTFKKYDVQLAQIALNEININNADLSAAIDAAQLIAPMDGVVLSMSASAGSEVQGYHEMAVVADTSVQEISSDAPSSAVAKIEKGMDVIISLATRPGVLVTGKVRRLPAISSTDSTTTIGEDKSVRISMDTDPAKLQLEIGDIVQVKVIIQNKPGTLWLPPQAIRSFEGRQFAVVQDGSGQRRVDVKTGITNEDQVEILEGLTEGQVVVSP
jgi:membrane fusion protein, macrolide-specific efflux system